MKVSLIGIGLMGQALGQHLLTQDINLTVFNRTTEKTSELLALGASKATSAQQAVTASDTVLLMLSDADAITSILDKISADALKDKLIIQMGTIGPQQSRNIAQKIENKGGRYLECPVLGSLPEARTGTLILMAGGKPADYETALPLLNIIGSEPRLIGPIGQGATVKLAMNQLIAGLTASFSLSLALVEKEGIDIEQFMSIVRDSALYAPTFDKKLDRMVKRDFSNPNFPTKHLSKDTDLFLTVAQQLGLDTSGLEGISALLIKALALGLADTDYSAVYAAINSDK
jgi:3-hydroxyisobutyrate dehydrogenase